MKKRRSVLIDLTGPVAVLTQDFYEWAIRHVKNPEWVSEPRIMMQTGMMNPFIEAVLHEIFKEHYLSSYIDEEPASNKFLREQGMSAELILKLKCEFLNFVVAKIYHTLPEINFMEVQECDYGLTTDNCIIIHITEDENAPMFLVATPPPSA